MCANDSRLLDIDNLITLCEECHENFHSANPVEIKNFDILEKEWREIVDRHHFEMSLYEMLNIMKEINGGFVKYYRVLNYMESKNYPFSFENKIWLSKKLKENSISEIVREFCSKDVKSLYNYDYFNSIIRKKTVEFGLLDSESRFLQQYFTCNGETKTIKEWAELAKISTGLIHQRLAKGLKGEDVLKPPTDINRYITIEGVTKPMSRWVEESGLNYNTFHYRLQKGVTGKDLLAPVKAKKIEQAN